jgi:hypothetical protein
MEALELIWCYDPDQRDQLAMAADRLNQACMYDDSRPEILTCYDLLFLIGIADLLQSVRVSSFEVVEPPRKKHKLNMDGVPIITFVTGTQRSLRSQTNYGTDTKIQIPFHLTNIKVDLPNCKAINHNS